MDTEDNQSHKMMKLQKKMENEKMQESDEEKPAKKVEEKPVEEAVAEPS